MSDNLRDALEKLVQEWRGSEPTEALYDALSELLAAHPVEPAPDICVVCSGSGFAAPSVPCGDSWHDAEDATYQPVASRERVTAALRVFLAKAYAAGMNRYNSGKVNPPTEVAKLDNLTSEAVDDLLAAGVFREEAECGAVDRTGQRRCVFTPGHHEAENWTSHGDRGGWTWNDQPTKDKVVHSGTGPCGCWACSVEE